MLKSNGPPINYYRTLCVNIKKKKKNLAGTFVIKSSAGSCLPLSIQNNSRLLIKQFVWTTSPSAADQPAEPPDSVCTVVRLILSELSVRHVKNQT